MKTTSSRGALIKLTAELALIKKLTQDQATRLGTRPSLGGFRNKGISESQNGHRLDTLVLRGQQEPAQLQRAVEVPAVSLVCFPDQWQLVWRGRLLCK